MAGMNPLTFVRVNAPARTIRATEAEAPSNPVIGHVGEPDENGRAPVIFNDEGRRIYGPNVKMFVNVVRPGLRMASRTTREDLCSGEVSQTIVSRRPSEPPADEPVVVG